MAQGDAEENRRAKDARTGRVRLQRKRRKFGSIFGDMFAKPASQYQQSAQQTLVPMSKNRPHQQRTNIPNAMLSVLTQTHRGIRERFTGYNTRGGVQQYRLPEMIPGIRHQVEEFEPPSYKRGATQKEISLYNEKIAAFKKRQSERAKIRPIADAEVEARKRRRKRARQLQQGRMGTMLSQRETLS